MKKCVYCMNEINENFTICPYCRKKTTVNHKKRKYGIIFILIQIFAIFCGANLENYSLPENFLGWIGYFLIGICGCILIIQDFLENKKLETKSNNKAALIINGIIIFTVIAIIFVILYI